MKTYQGRSLDFLCEPCSPPSAELEYSLLFDLCHEDGLIGPFGARNVNRFEALKHRAAGLNEAIAFELEEMPAQSSLKIDALISLRLFLGALQTN